MIVSGKPYSIKIYQSSFNKQKMKSMVQMDGKNIKYKVLLTCHMDQLNTLFTADMIHVKIETTYKGISFQKYIIHNHRI